MDAKKYIPFTINFAPVEGSASGLLEISPNQVNNDATKYRVEQTNGSLSLQLVSTTQQVLRLQVHLGEGSLTGGSWSEVAKTPAATSTQRVVASETVVVPIPAPGKAMHIRVHSATGYTPRTEDLAAVCVYPLPGVENLT